MPIKSTSPVREIGVGGVSERAGVKAGGSNPSAKASTFAFDAVKGILIFGKAVLFAGHC
jgi:hypothetical protein